MVGKPQIKKEVKNKNLWTELDDLSSAFDIEWIWVKAHSTDELNNEVDLMARSSAINLCLEKFIKN